MKMHKKEEDMHEAIYYCSQNVTSNIFPLDHKTAVAIAGMRGIALDLHGHSQHVMSANDVHPRHYAEHITWLV